MRLNRCETAKRDQTPVRKMAIERLTGVNRETFSRIGCRFARHRRDTT